MTQTDSLLSSPSLRVHPLADFFKLYEGLEAHFTSQSMAAWLQTLPSLISGGLSVSRWGDLPGWYTHWQQLPSLETCRFDYQQDAVSLFQSDARDAMQPYLDQQSLRSTLMGLHPWRKGPFHFFGVDIDTEWRSCLKWDRIAPHLDLTDKNVLDVGCGNGYYGWRMLGAGARSVIGIDPSPRFVLQWGCIRRYCPTQPCYVLPLGIEDLPPKLQAFDMTFSMGVLYHRRSCFDHLYQLKDTLKPGGQLMLETLVIPGPLGMTLLPKDRYAKMRNVWQLPSTATLVSWLERCGFAQVSVVDESLTTPSEQRRTDWMHFESLADFLDPEDDTKTIEGYPAPRRAVVTAFKP